MIHWIQTELISCPPANVFTQDPLRKTKDDLVDLQLEHKQRKKRSSKERDHKWAVGRESGDSRGSSRERSTEKSSKRHKKSKYVPDDH